MHHLYTHAHTSIHDRSLSICVLVRVSVAVEQNATWEGKGLWLILPGNGLQEVRAGTWSCC